MTNFPNNSLENPNVLHPTPRDCFDRHKSHSPHKIIPLRASLANSISDFDEDDTKAQNQVLSSLKRGPESPRGEEFQSTFPNKRQGDNEGLPPANPLSTGKYSLDADMLFGWRPKVAVKAPIPLRFSNSIVEEVVNTLHYEKKTEQFPDLIYQGFRPDNTLDLHQKLATSETYSSKLHAAFQSKQTTYWGSVNAKRPFSGMKDDVSEDCLVFDSMFEHGNMDTAIWKSPNEYDLFLRADSNTRGHTNWYNFKVKNMKKGQTVKFNIMNLSKHDSLYQRGMKPYMYSEKLNEEKGIKWEQSGENICFKLANISYLGQNFEEFCKKKHYKVSFEYTFPYDEDTVSFALCIPYSYTQLIQFIQTLVDTHKPADQGGFLTQSKLCCSLGGVDVPLLTITDPDESEIPLSRRQYIICSGRVHPGEPNSSWMLQGFINELLKTNEETRYLTRRFIFKIVPMLNPDGVILGNHRTGFCGNDLNRQYITPQEMLHPSVYSLKELIRDLVQEKKDSVFAYFDFHGHSLMKSVFMYGPEFPIHSYNYYKVKILPKLISKRTEMFRFQSCTYTVTRGKLATARAVFSMHFGIVHSYTIEASYSSYLSAEKESVPFNEESFMKMGIMLVEGIRDYKRLLDEEEAAAAAYRAARLGVPNCETPELDVTIEEEGETNGEFEGDRKTKNKFRVKKGKGRKVAANKKGDFLGDPAGNKIVIVPKERRSKTEPLVIPEINNPGIGMFSILEEIKNDALKKDSENIDSYENRSADDSDKGDADDDLEEDEMKLLQENIISNIIELSKEYKEEKPDYKAYKIKPKKLKKPAEEKSKANKEKKFLTQIAEKEALEPSLLERTPAQNPRPNHSPPKSALTSTKYFQRAHNWITRIKQKTPLIPREVQMIVEKPSDSIDVQDQSINFRTGAFMATKNGFRRHIVSSYAQRKKQSESFEQSKKTIDSTYQPHKPGDIIPNHKKVSELKASIYEQSLSRPLSGYLKKSNTCVLSETNNGDPESRLIQSRQSSLKALLREPKCRSRSRFEKMEAHSLDQKDMRETFDNFTSNQIFYEEKECDRSVENSRDFGKTANGNMAPRITIVQAQMKADNVPGVALSLKKDKKLPMAYVAYKNNIRLKKKIRDKKVEGH